MTSDIEQLTNKITELENKIIELESHKKPKAVDQPVECEICHKKLKNKYILKTHMATKHNDKREKCECPHCGKSLCNKYYLTKHLAVKHPNQQ